MFSIFSYDYHGVTCVSLWHCNTRWAWAKQNTIWSCATCVASHHSVSDSGQTGPEQVSWTATTQMIKKCQKVVFLAAYIWFEM